MAHFSSRSIWFFICCLLIIGISVHDAWLVIICQDVITETEQNPVALMLIEKCGGNVTMLVTVKMLGTSLAGTILVSLYRTRRAMAVWSASVVACMQCGLLLYLLVGGPNLVQ